MEISKPCIITWHRSCSFGKRRRGAGKVFSWKEGDRAVVVAAVLYSFCLEIKSLALRGRRWKQGLSFKPDLHARLLPPGVAATATVEEVVVPVPILVVVVVYSKGGPLGFPTHSWSTTLRRIEREGERESDVILWKTNINDRRRFIFRRIVCLYTSIYRLILFGSIQWKLVCRKKENFM